ncbi:DUF6457 domain-containing protein [Dactylosporangium roseum]|uniref:DUF6457 domain-containing protein n=1 Tax=Dactylosporangium roseum TaxID=47989 RepID=UPI0021B31228|nr:DUF6457 domain-containing protein [Dactylosporangium roseum]
MSDEGSGARLDTWLGEAARTLGVSPLTVDERAAILALARDVAHNVARPGAPLTAFLLGLAIGRGADPQHSREVLTRLATRAEGTIEAG